VLVVCFALLLLWQVRWAEFISQPALLPLRTLRATVLHCNCTPVNFVCYVILNVVIFGLRATTIMKSEPESVAERLAAVFRSPPGRLESPGVLDC